MQFSTFKGRFISLVLITVLGIGSIQKTYATNQYWYYNLGSATTGNFSANTTGTNLSSPYLAVTGGGSSFYRTSTSSSTGSVGVASGGFGSNSYISIVGPSGSSVNKYSVHDISGGAGNLFYFKCLVRPNNNSAAAQYLLTMGSNSVSGSQVYNNGSNVADAATAAGFRMNFTSASSVTMEYRNTSGGWSNTSASISANSDYVIEFYVNNSTSSSSYTFNGASVSLASNTYDIYVNGVIAKSGAACPNTAAATVDSWMFYSTSCSSTSNSFFIDDISYANYFGPFTYTSTATGNTNGEIWQNDILASGAERLNTYNPNNGITIANGHTVTLNVDKTNINNITVNTGGILKTGTASTAPLFFNVFGNITANGTVGVSSDDGIAFNMEDGTHTISGTGAFYCSRIRKSDENGSSGTSTVNINMNAKVFFTGTSGSAAGIYSNRSATSIYNVNIASGVTVVVSGDLCIDGSNGTSGTDRYGTYTISGTLTVNGTVYLTTNNTSTHTCTITVANGGILNANTISALASGVAGHVLNVNTGGTLKLTNGDFSTPSATNNTYTFSSGSTVEFGANGAQNIDVPGTYSNLTISGSGTKTMQGNIASLAQLLVAGTATLATNGHTLTYAGSANLDYNGSAAQTTGSEQPSTINNLTVNNSSGIILGSALTVNNLVAFNSGTVQLGAFKLIVGTSGSFTGAGPSNYIFTNSSGTLEMQANATGVLFPIGDSYNPITIKTSTGTATFDASVSNGVTDASNAAILDYVVNRVWAVSVTSGTATIKVTPQWNDLTDLAGAHLDLNNVFVAYRTSPTSGAWIRLGTPGLATNLGSNAYSVLSDNLTVTAGTTYYFGVGSIQAGALPVSLVQFSAKQENSNVLLNWETASELNNSHFDVERSSDGNNWKAIGTISGHGNTSSINNYSLVDIIDGAASQILYYRLKQLDFNGDATYSEIRSVTLSYISNLSMYPNPAIDQVNLSFESILNGNATLKVLDLEGHIVQTNNISIGKGTFRQSLDVTHLSKGSYFLQVSMGTNSNVYSFFKN